MKKPLENMISLLHQVSDRDVLHYIEEAYVCYEAGAYRACIVMTVNAVFEDLLRKTRRLAKIVEKGDIIVKEIEAIVFEQKAFEQTLVERLAGADIISTVQSQRLLQLIDHRNKAAHPSGVDASPEEARFVFAEAIEKFLQHRGMSGYDVVANLFLRLPDANFFPDEAPRTLEDVVHSELVSLDSRSLNAIAARLGKELFSKDLRMARNAKLLLQGLCYQERFDIFEALCLHLVKPRASDPRFVAKIFDVFAIDARFLLEFESMDQRRLDAGIANVFLSLPLNMERKSIEHPMALLDSMLRWRFPDETMTGEFEKTTRALSKLFGSDVSVLLEMPLDGEVRKMFFDQLLITIEGHGYANIASTVCRTILENMEALSRIVHEEEALRLVLALASSSELSEELQRDGYRPLQPLIHKAAWGLQLRHGDAEEFLDGVADRHLRALLRPEAA